MNYENLIGRALVLMAATSCVTCAATAQSLGDVARDERARRAGLKSHGSVLTNEDLKRDQILNSKPVWPATDAATESATKTPPAPLTIAPINAFVAIDHSQDVSLGEYARVIRAQRALRDAARAKEILEANFGQPIAPSLPKEIEVTKVVAGHRRRPADMAAPKVRFAFSWPSLPKQHASAYLAPRHEMLARPMSYAKLVAATPVRRQAKRSLKQAAITHTSVTHAAAARTAVKAPVLKASVTKASPVKSAKAATQAAKADSIQGSAIRVQRGESLWALARKHLGSGKLWTRIWKANPELRDPNVIRAGMTLSLPTITDIHVARKAPGSIIKAAVKRAALDQHEGSLLPMTYQVLPIQLG